MLGRDIRNSQNWLEVIHGFPKLRSGALVALANVRPKLSASYRCEGHKAKYSAYRRTV